MDDPDLMIGYSMFNALAAGQHTDGGILHYARMNGRQFLPWGYAMAKIDRWNIRKLQECGNCFEVMLPVNDLGRQVNPGQVEKTGTPGETVSWATSPRTLL
jgi:hypothetical protein